MNYLVIPLRTPEIRTPECTLNTLVQINITSPIHGVDLEGPTFGYFHFQVDSAEPPVLLSGNIGPEVCYKIIEYQSQDCAVAVEIGGHAIVSAA